METDNIDYAKLVAAQNVQNRKIKIKEINSGTDELEHIVTVINDRLHNA